MFIEFSLLRIVGLFFQHRIIFFYTQQLEWNSQITFQLKPKYTHPSYTPFIVDSPYCVLSLSPTFIFTIMWLSNLLFISSKSSSQWSRLLSSWVVLMSLQLCVCFIFFTVKPYGLWIIQIVNPYSAYELSICMFVNLKYFIYLIILFI